MHSTFLVTSFFVVTLLLLLSTLWIFYTYINTRLQIVLYAMNLFLKFLFQK